MLKLAKFYILNMNSLLCANHISGYTKQTKLLPGVEPEFRRLLVWGKQLKQQLFFQSPEFAFKSAELALFRQKEKQQDKSHCTPQNKTQARALAENESKQPQTLSSIFGDYAFHY